MASGDTSPEPPAGDPTQASTDPSTEAPPGRAHGRQDAGARRPRRGRLQSALHRNPATSMLTKSIVTAVGIVVLIAGLIMMVTPGPGLLGIVVGLAILATEWDWAQRLLETARRALERSREKAASVDPAVRRRYLILWSTVAVVVAAAIAVLVWLFGWPPLVLDLWGWLQSRAGWLPDLPGA